MQPRIANLDLEDLTILTHQSTQLGTHLIMSDLNRGIMKFKNADKPIVVALSSLLVFGSIAFLIIWALTTAYAI